MHSADALEAQQQSAKLVLPGEHALDRAEPFAKDVRVEPTLSATLGLLATPAVLGDVGDQSAIEDRLAIGVAVVTPSKLTMLPRSSIPTALAMSVSAASAGTSSGDSFWFPGAATSGASRRGSVQGSTFSDVMPREKDSWRPVGGPNPTKISRDRVVP